MSVTSSALAAAATLDSVGRFIANVGVPAAITFFLLSQITPRLDTMATLQAQANTNLAIIGATCSGRPLTATSFELPSRGTVALVALDAGP